MPACVALAEQQTSRRCKARHGRPGTRYNGNKPPQRAIALADRGAVVDEVQPSKATACSSMVAECSRSEVGGSWIPSPIVVRTT